MSRKKPTPPPSTEPQVRLKPLKAKFVAKGERQKAGARAWGKGKDLMLDGYPGTGKTYMALSLALTEVLKPGSTYDKVIIFRSLVPTREVGFLKGGPKEKAEIYEKPYIGLVGEILDDPSAYGRLKSSGKIEFESTSFERGCNHKNAIIICDEIQNFVWQEINTVFTRRGENCRMIICGDAFQDDVSSVRFHSETGMRKLQKVVEHMDEHFTRICFEVSDICRSEFVKDYIITIEELGYHGG